VERADCVAAGGERRAALEEGKRVERIAVRLFGLTAAGVRKMKPEAGWGSQEGRTVERKEGKTAWIAEASRVDGIRLKSYGEGRKRKERGRRRKERGRNEERGKKKEHRSLRRAELIGFG